MTEVLPAFRGIVGQVAAVTRLARAIDAGAVAHAYIFEGPAGVGKHATANAFAKALVCGAGGCGRCSDCVRISHGTHPDVFEIDPEGLTLGIEQIRDVQHQVVLRPVEGAHKVFIIDEAEAMTPQAANAFLRTLEEPPPGVVFVLIASNVHAMLDTILSRAQRVPFRPIPPAEIAALLQERLGIDMDQAELATSVSGGIVGKALALARTGGMDLRNAALSLAADLSVLDPLDLMQWVETTVKSVRDSSSEEKTSRQKEAREQEETAISRSHASFVHRVLEQRAKREVAQMERRRMEEILSTLESWFRDVLVTREGTGELVVNLDREDDIRQASLSISPEAALRSIEAAGRARRMIRQNVSPRLAFESMLFDMQECDKCGV